MELICFSFQTNVSIDARFTVWIGQRPELLCVAGDGSDRWLPIQVLRITVGASWWCWTPEPPEHLHSPRQPCTRITLASSAHQLQQNQAHQQHSRQQWTCKYHRQIIRLSRLFYAWVFDNQHLRPQKNISLMTNFPFRRSFWPACTNTSHASTSSAPQIHRKSLGRPRNHLHSTRRSLSLSQLIR